MLDSELKLDMQLVDVLNLATRRSKDLNIPCATTYTFLLALLEYGDEYLEAFLLENDIEDNITMKSALKVCRKHQKEENTVAYVVNVSHGNVDFEVQFSKEFLEVLSIALEISNTYKYGYISSLEMLMAMTTLKTVTFLDFLDNIKLDENSIEEVFGHISSNNSEIDLIPEELSHCLVNISETIDENSTCRILGRDKEVNALEKILLKATKRNAVLVGEPGIGKSAIMEKLAWKIKTGNCPEQFKNMTVVSLDVNSIIAGTMYRGQAEERFSYLVQFLNNHQNVILFIDEIHLLLGAGSTIDSGLDLANALKPILARSQTRVVGATTLEEYEKFFSRDGALKRRFEKIIVKEPTTEEVYPMIKNQIAYLEEVHKVKISKDVVDFVILNASCFNYETKNPDRTLDLIDRSMATANLEGKDEVTKESVLSVFNVNIEKFKNMSDFHKKSTAYHEVGHYLLIKYSKELIDRKVLAISIMPAEGYLGVTVWEKNEENFGSANREYYIQQMAVSLAGRIAEKRFTGTISAGACSDLEKATKTARNLVTRFGMAQTLSQNRVYIQEQDTPMYNDEMITLINSEIDKILEEAYKYAEKCIEDHVEELELLVSELLVKGILSSDDLKKSLKSKYQKLLRADNLFYLLFFCSKKDKP